MLNISTEDPIAVAVVGTIHKGDVESLKLLLEKNPSLATARLSDPNECKGMSRSLLHVATDWPGHFPNGARTVVALIAAGAEVNARFTGSNTETLNRKSTVSLSDYSSSTSSPSIGTVPNTSRRATLPLKWRQPLRR